jgi:hypothetical protein
VVAQRDGVGAEMTFAWDAGKQEARSTDADDISIYDGYHGNVLIYSQRSTGDADNHRYNRRLDRNLVVNGNQFQHVVQFRSEGQPDAGRGPAGLRREDEVRRPQQPDRVHGHQGLYHHDWVREESAQRQDGMIQPCVGLLTGVRSAVGSDECAGVVLG